MTEKILLVEVGPRDGLQNEKTIIPTDIKIQFIEKLIAAGHKAIEIGAFVSPKWVPQMEDSSKIVSTIVNKYALSNVRFPVLVPNVQGLEDAITTGVKEIAIFGSASETFSKKNINASFAESLERFKEVIKIAKQHKIRIRGYISCVMDCPYEGEVPIAQVVSATEKLYRLGCDEISLGDTIGTGSPYRIRGLLRTLKPSIPVSLMAVHFHDTYGQALANIYASIEEGIRIIDASVSGLGGCPYAKGATGNVATEDVLYMLHGMGFETGIDMGKLLEASHFISSYLKREPQSKLARIYDRATSLKL